MIKSFAKIFAVVISVFIMLTSTVNYQMVFAAQEEEFVILDAAKRSTITKTNSFFVVESKITDKGSNSSAKWSISDSKVVEIDVPEDFTPYTELAVRVYSETDCTIYVRLESENEASDEWDYYGQVQELKKGWQDISLAIADIQKHKTPKGYNFISKLVFQADGWRQENDYSSMVLYFDSIKLINNSEYTKLIPTDVKDIEIEDSTSIVEKVGDKVLYNNNFDSEEEFPDDNLVVSAKNNRIDIAKEADNAYIGIEMISTDNCHIDRQGILTDSSWFVMEFDLRTDTGFSGNIQYKDASEARGTGTLISFQGYDILFSKSVVGSLQKGKWTNIKIVFDVINLKETVYINGNVVLENAIYSKAALKGISLLRLYISNNQAEGTDIKVDNLKIYEGNALRDIGNQQPEIIESPAGDGIVGGKYKSSTKAKDVQESWPEISKISNGVALMINTSKAFAKGALTNVDSNEEVVPVIVDSRTLVPVRFIAESFDAEVNWDGDARKVSVVSGDKKIELIIDSNVMTVNGTENTIDVPAVIIQGRTMLPLRALVEALGKNVLWDTRGLIVITDKEILLDAQNDVKLSSMLIGYLKTGELKNNYAVYPVFTQSVIDQACAAEFGAYTDAYREESKNRYAVKALYYLTLISRFYPEAKSSSGVLCKDAALAQLRNMIKGGNEPIASCGPHWTHAEFISDLLLVKNTPVVYNELTSEEKERMDWLVRAHAISGNWGYNDKNFYTTGVDMTGNFGKTYNPNYRNTYCSIVVSAILYFGAEQLDEYFVNFSYDEYMAKFKELGFTNIISTWEHAGKDLMENGGECILVGGVDDRYTEGMSGGYGVGVKVPFVYNGNTSKDVQAIFSDLMKYTYAFDVISGFGTVGAADHSYILSGKTSPFQGKMGMMREFASSDGGGSRSSTGYVNGSFTIMNSVYANMKMFGNWDSSTKAMREIDRRAYIGNEDLIFKLREGYYSYQSGKGGNSFESGLINSGYSMDKDIWRNFHLMDNYQVEIAEAKDPALEALEKIPAAEPKDGVTSAPEGSYKSTLYNKGVDEAGFYKLDKEYKKATVEFDAIVGSGATDGEYNSVIIFDKNKAGGIWQDFNMLIQFNKGTINVMNGGKYSTSSVRFGANYRFKFKVEFDVTNKKYSVWVTQNYPEAKETVCLAENFDFRSSASEIDSVTHFAIAQNIDAAGMDMWLENFVIYGE